MNIEEFKTLSVKGCVYCILFPDGKRYVGKTKDLRSRISLYERFCCGNRCVENAIKSFGLESLDFSVLSEVKCNDLTDLELCLSILEIRYIRELNTLSPSGYNVSLGGECLGIPSSCITTDKSSIQNFYKSSKAVLLYDSDGKFVEEYESLSKLAYDKGSGENHMSKYLNKRVLFCNKWFVRSKKYDYIPQQIEVPNVKQRVIYKNIIKERVIYKDRVITTKHSVLKYDMDGNFCGEYRSKIEASRSFSCNYRIPYGYYRDGYILFKRGSGEIPKKIEPYSILNNKQLGEYYVPASELKDKEKKIMPITNFVTGIVSNNSSTKVKGRYSHLINDFRIGQYDLYGTLVREFASIRDASDETGVRYSSIYNCVLGKTNTAYGYIWKKID